MITDDFLGAWNYLILGMEKTAPAMDAAQFDKVVFVRVLMRDDGVNGSESGSLRKLLQLGHLPDEKSWLAMLRWRNVSAHEYDEEKADALAAPIHSRFLPALDRLSEALEQKVREAQGDGTRPDDALGRRWKRNGRLSFVVIQPTVLSAFR